MKRGRGESLTGGSGDVNPQWFKIASSAAPTTAMVTTTFPLPTNRLESPSRPTIVEILKVKWVVTALNITTAGPDMLRAYLMTKSPITTEPAITDGTILDALILGQQTVTSGSVVQDCVFDHNLTDEAGHGMLVATDNIFMGIIQTAAASPVTSVVAAWILYRLKRVGLSEYIGIVQGQQQKGVLITLEKKKPK